MNDINFFKPYLGKKKINFNNKFFLSILLLIISLSILGYGVINHLKINKLSEKVLEFQKVAENPKVLKRVEEIKLEEEELNAFKLEVESIRDLKKSLVKKDIIGSLYIDAIISKRPNDLFLTSLYITPENVSITGISNNRLSIAEFAKGLESIEGLGDIFVSNIVREETDYKFELESNLLEEEEVEDGTVKEKDEEPEEDEKEN
ncbi:PilN domain-containing protein [Tissierella creatinophila]|uniref:Fimbrial assembly protein PilN n=1 Tax=Tissierella creatinophila DSM 6911 TaxID=1123403 RepID=A0A1U7M9A5_TISCR|nr:PilN domain-containing protein [Tissierella creatinophila]OLS03924.1 fimbrial assembly protein PilN [Tissierella creatinophila DSM 6911]